MSADLSQRAEMAASKKIFVKDSDRIKVTEARKILGISNNKMASLIGDGTLQSEQDPLDHRVKLVSRKEVERLKQRSVHGK